ncbi:MAG: M28 family peptidase [Bacteroidetes bacterium]|nr:MAG: M28 family peptidase [Bacteroidota bacterium]
MEDSSRFCPRLRGLFLPLGLALLSVLSCTQRESRPAPQAEESVPSVPSFQRDSAYAFLKAQVDFGPRVPNTEAHERCRAWLVEQFRRFGATVREQAFEVKAFTGEVLRATNIIAEFNPEAGKRLLLCAHWDSRPFADSPLSPETKDQPVLGADDGASGVAVLLEVARQLQRQPPPIGVDIVLFDVEDYGENQPDKNTTNSWCLGSQHWARHPHRSPYRPKFGILLDMVGAHNARFTKEQTSMRYAPQVMNKVWTLAQKLGYGTFFVNDNTPALTDDHYFINLIARIPTIDIINRAGNTPTGFAPHWHTPDDNLDVISKRTLKAVGQTVLEVVYREAQGRF